MRQLLPVRPRAPAPARAASKAAPLPVRAKNTLQAWDSVIRKNAARAEAAPLPVRKQADRAAERDKTNLIIAMAARAAGRASFEKMLDSLDEKFTVALLRKWDADYYNERPSVTDAVYDNTRRWFARRYPNNPYNESVGAPLPAKIQKEALPIMMGSLDKLRPADVAGWMRAVEKVLAQPRGWFLAPKFDGSSALLKYVPGKSGHVLAKAWRRGTGDVGGDVTATAKYVQGVRHVLKPIKNIDPKGTYLVRVEVVMHRAIFSAFYSEATLDAEIEKTRQRISELETLIAKGGRREKG